MTAEDPRARRVFEIATLKTEYVDELSAVRARRRQNVAEWEGRASSRVAIAVRQGQIRSNADPQGVALGLWALTEGLIRNWLINPSFDLQDVGCDVVTTYLNGLRSPDGAAGSASSRRPDGAQV